MSEISSFLRLSNILLYVYAPHFACWFICQWTLGCLHVFAVGNNAAITCMFQYLFKTFLSILLSLYSEVELLDHMIIPSLTFQSNQQVDFHSSCTISYSYQQCLSCCLFLPTFGIVASCFLEALEIDMISIVVLICIFPKFNEVEHVFMYSFAICISSVGKCPFLSFAYFLIGSFLPLEFWQNFTQSNKG